MSKSSDVSKWSYTTAFYFINSLNRFLSISLSIIASSYKVDSVYENDLFDFISDKPKYKKMIRSKIQQRDNPFSSNGLLNDLIIQRVLLNYYMTKAQSLIKEEGPIRVPLLLFIKRVPRIDSQDLHPPL